jgi:lipoyl-dependent peroxiredoxin
MNKSASVKWSGGLKDGRGAISTQSGALADLPYGFASRFEGAPGTNPEELVGAAHAACFTMAFTLFLNEAKFRPDSVETKSTVTLEKDGPGFTITACHLDMSAKIPEIDEKTFQQLAAGAKANCPVSKLFANNAKITLSATLLDA